eukprot:XP_011668740.1 PREDICTED: insulin-like growth factor-binding protein complex acid labile subunit [Strongylocentrotus purpuratus]
MNNISLSTFNVGYFMGHVEIDRLLIASSGIKYIHPANISSIQKGNVPLIKELYLNFNILSNIPGYALRGFEKLQVLNLQGNRISSINNESFCGLHSLVYLSLSWNKISSLPRASFACASNLLKIDLSRNYLATLDPQWFDGSLFLRSLFIDQSGIRSIMVGPWKATNLQTLVLTRNNLDSLYHETFTGLSNLKALNLSRNANRFRMSEDALISTLILRYNSLDTLHALSGIFTPLGSLVELDLTSCRIRQVASGTFANLTTLLQLCLPENKITSISKDAFQGLHNLRVLQLQYNSIAFIEQGL